MVFPILTEEVNAGWVGKLILNELYMLHEVCHIILSVLLWFHLIFLQNILKGTLRQLNYMLHGQSGELCRVGWSAK